jgi:hypothetical protein
VVSFVFGEINLFTVQFDPDGEFGQVVVVQSITFDALPPGLTAQMSVNFNQTITEHIQPGFEHGCFLTKLAHPCTPS